MAPKFRCCEHCDHEHENRLLSAGKPCPPALDQQEVGGAQECVEGVAEALTTLGAAYRGYWGYVDGRTLRDELGELAIALRSGEFDFDRWMSHSGICRECGQWLLICDGHEREKGPTLPIHRTEAGRPRCSTCDGGGCLDCTDPA